MEKTHSLRRALVVRIEIFGFIFLMALLAALFAGCGDGTEPTGSPDSGTGTKTGTGTATATCSAPGPGETYTPPRPGTTVQYFVAEGTVTCGNPGLLQAPYKSFTCQELVTNSMSAYSLGVAGEGPCCVSVTKDPSRPGYVIVNPPTSDVGCAGGSGDLATEGGQYALCSTSGAFLGWICPYSFDS